MSWPLSQDYNEAIQDPQSSFSDAELRDGEATTNALGMPMPRSGNFADVYEYNCPATRSKWAIKCFTRHVSGQRERYTEIDRTLQESRLPFAVEFQYLVKGILVRGDWFPILKMRWIEGQLLNEIVRDNLDKPAVLNQLMQIWARMGKRLRETGIAHADLQHGNVLFVPGSQKSSLAVKLIDYDGMFVPALNGKKSGEVGHPNFQHPQRLREGVFNAEVDRFPLLVVATALRALSVGGRSLWERYDNGDNLLFKENDLREPEESALFKELQDLPDPQVRMLVAELQKARRGKLEEVSAVDELLPEAKPTSVRTPGGAAPVVPSAKTAIPSVPLSEAVTAAVPAPPPVPVTSPLSAEAPPARSALDFGDTSPRVPKRKVALQRSGVPIWAWIAGGSTAAVIIAVLLVVMLRGGKDKGKDGPAVAQNGNGGDPVKRDKDKPGKDVVPDERGKPDPVKPPDKEKPIPDPIKPIPDPIAKGDKIVTFMANGDVNPLLAISVNKSNTWQLRDPKTPPPFTTLKEFAGHQGPVTVIVLSDDGKRALTSSADRTVRLWDVDKGTEIRSLGEYERPVVLLAISADGTRGASSDGGDTVRLWNLETGKESGGLKLDDSVTSMALSADGKQLLFGVGGTAPGKNVVLQTWDFDSGMLKKSWNAAGGKPVNCVAFSADGTWGLSSVTANKMVNCWDLTDQKRSGMGVVPSGTVCNLTFSTDGKYILIATNTQYQLYLTSPIRQVRAHSLFREEMVSIRFTKGDKGVGFVARKLDGGELVYREATVAPGDSPVLPTTPAQEPFYVLAGDPEWVVQTNPKNNSWEIYEALKDLKSPRFTFLGHTGPVTCVAVSGDRKKAVSGSEDGTARVWDIETGTESAKIEGFKRPVCAVAISADGSRVVACDGTNRVPLWEALPDAQSRHLEYPSGSVNHVRLSPNGKTIYLGANDGAAPPRYDHSFWNFDTGTLVKELESGNGRPPLIVAAFSPDGDTLALAQGKGVVLYSGVSQQKIVRKLLGGRLASNVNRVSFSPDGQLVMVEVGNHLFGYVSKTEEVVVNHDAGVPAHSGCFRKDGKEFLSVRRLNDVLRASRVATNEKRDPVVVKPDPTPKAPVRLPRPEMQLVKEAQKVIHERHKKEYVNRESADYNRVHGLLVKQMQAPEVKDDPVQLYAYCLEMRDYSLSFDFGVTPAMSACRRLARTFEIDEMDMLCSTLEMSSAAIQRDPFVAFHEGLSILQEAILDDRFEIADRVLKVLQKANLGLQKANLVSRAAADLQDMQRMNDQLVFLRKEQVRLKKALTAVADTPEPSPQDCLSVGGYLCCGKDAWGQGLPLLARGADEGLKTLAKKDLDTPDDAVAQKALGDLWLVQADRATNAVMKAAYRRRAGLWYNIAATANDPNRQAEAEKALKALAAKLPELSVPWSFWSIQGSTVAGSSLIIAKNHEHSTRDSYRGSMDLRLMVKPVNGKFTLRAGGVSMLYPRAKVTDDLSIYFDLPNGGSKEKVKKEVILKPNQWCVLRLQITPNRTTFWVDGEKVLEAATDSDLSKFRRITFGLGEAGGEVKHMTINSIP